MLQRLASLSHGGGTLTEAMPPAVAVRILKDQARPWLYAQSAVRDQKRLRVRSSPAVIFGTTKVSNFSSKSSVRSDAVTESRVLPETSAKGIRPCCASTCSTLRHGFQLWQSIEIRFLFSSRHLRDRHLKVPLLIQPRDYFIISATGNRPMRRNGSLGILQFHSANALLRAM